jgi:hypothetical protein
MLKALKGPPVLRALQADLVRAKSLGMPSDYCGRLTVSESGSVGYLRCYAEGHPYPPGELWQPGEHRIVELASKLEPTSTTTVPSPISSMQQLGNPSTSASAAAGAMAACMTGGQTTTAEVPADTADTGNGNSDGSAAFDAVVASAAATDAGTSPFLARPKCSRCGINDATLVAVHCGCIAACAPCANQSPHSTRSRTCFKCGQAVSAYVQVQGDVAATLPPPGELNADDKEEETTDEEEEG